MTSLEGCGTLTVDGFYGAATQAAVFCFQRKFNLGQDGKVGAQTRQKIVDLNGGFPD